MAFRGLVRYGIAFTLILAAANVYGQVDFSRGTRETDRFSNKDKEIEKKIRTLPKRPMIEMEKSVVGLEEQKFFVKKIDLAGCVSLSPDAFSSLIKNYENREVALSELKDLAGEIEKEYSRRGIEAVVSVPSDSPKDQTVTLQVLEGGI